MNQKKPEHTTQRTSPNQSVELAVSILDLLQEPAFLLDESSHLIHTNPVAEEHYGATSRFGTGQDMGGLFHDKELFQSLLNRALEAGGVAIHDELTAIDRSGESVPVWATIKTIPVRGRKNCLVMSLIPKTRETRLLHNAREMGLRVENLYTTLAEVRAELLERTIQLGEQKNKMLAILRGMGDGLLVCDGSGGIIQYNEVAREVLRLPEGDLENRAVGQLCPELSQVLGISPQTGNAPMQLAREENFIVGNRELRVSIAPLYDNRERYLGLVMILQDRTKQAEIDRMKSDLISIVSHELRSPLTSIKGYIDLLISGDLGAVAEEHRKYLEIVLNNANRLATLIDDMLDLSRIESGKLTMIFGKVDIKYLCDFVYLTFKPQAAQKKLNFRLEVVEGLSISGDMDRLQQALTNLVSNAIKYTPEDGTVRIRAYRDNGNVCLEVSDTGFGISPENQRKLFQKFFRVKDRRTRNIGGTGLGLCITKSIVEAHEGEVTVESQEGTGSTFRIRLPEYHG